MGLEVAVGILIAWAASKARRAGKQLDGAVDTVVDASAIRVRDLLLRKLGHDSAVRQLQLEAGESEKVSKRTKSRVTLAIEEAAEQDVDFAAQLKAALAEVQQAGDTTMTGTAHATGPGGIAIGVVGRDANLGQAPDPHEPGRE